MNDLRLLGTIIASIVFVFVGCSAICSPPKTMGADMARLKSDYDDWRSCVVTMSEQKILAHLGDRNMAATVGKTAERCSEAQWTYDRSSDKYCPLTAAEMGEARRRDWWPIWERLCTNRVAGVPASQSNKGYDYLDSSNPISPLRGMLPPPGVK